MIKAGLTITTAQINGGFIGSVTIQRHAVPPASHIYRIGVEAMIKS
jgi:hypothetical protein